MPRALVVTARFHDGRYHGAPDWPPSPARLFQALVAAAAQGAAIPEPAGRALAALERLAPPEIAAPAARRARAHTAYVPNNDLDAVGGDFGRIAEIRVGKTIRPWLFDASVPLLYCWRLDESSALDPETEALRAVVERLYQLGRGVDMAFATAEILDAEAAAARLDAHPGSRHRPARGEGQVFACPMPGSLKSLAERHGAAARRFVSVGTRRKPQVIFTQPPKPLFRSVAYDSPPMRLLYDLDGSKTPWLLERAVALVETVRDEAARRLREKLPAADAATIERVFIGNGATEADKAQRLRIVPLPSIGMIHTDPRIRRLLVELPPDMPQCLRRGDVAWAFDGVTLADADGEVELTLVPDAERGMLGHYGIETEAPAARLWRTVTAAALPESARRRRIDPSERALRPKPGSERAAEEATAAAAVHAALRHADVRAVPVHIRVQREPFGAKGARAEAFAPGTRFAKERLWHVEIGFAEAISGPLLIGDGRYLGLGLMQPVRGGERRGLVSFAIRDGLAPDADPIEAAHALRRAVMARVQAEQPTRPLPAFFSGHERSGDPARPGNHRHVAVVADLPRARLYVLAPHVLEQRRPADREEREQVEMLERVCRGLDDLRAGRAGRLALAPDPAGGAALTAPARRWRSLTPYAVTRHAALGSAATAVEADILAEIERLRLPRPRITVTTVRTTQTGLTARADLEFAVVVSGPIVIGRTRHKGGGVFVNRTS